MVLCLGTYHVAECHGCRNMWQVSCSHCGKQKAESKLKSISQGPTPREPVHAPPKFPTQPPPPIVAPAGVHEAEEDSSDSYFTTLIQVPASLLLLLSVRKERYGASMSACVRMCAHTCVHVHVILVESRGGR